MVSLPGYIDAKDVVLRMTEDDGRMLIVDVRDNDFFEGHIKSAKQVPSGKFGSDKNIDELIDMLPSCVDLIVVHCQLSQVRGPKCARRLLERLQSDEWRERMQTQPEVKVLRYGYDGFFDQYHIQPDLFEDLQ